VRKAAEFEKKVSDLTNRTT